MIRLADIIKEIESPRTKLDEVSSPNIVVGFVDSNCEVMSFNNVPSHEYLEQCSSDWKQRNKINWRYNAKYHTVYWYQEPSEEQKQAVKDEIGRKYRGFTVRYNVSIGERLGDLYQKLQGKAHGISEMDVPPPAHYQAASQSITNSEFLKFMMNVENAELKGRDSKTGTWHPRVSPEGGLETVGYGHKLKSWSEIRKYTGISDKDVVKLLRDDLAEANKKVHDYIKNHYGAKILLSQKQEEMLTEFAFSLGGLDKFPKFTEAVLRNDIPTIKKEYKRFYRDKNQTPIELERRNKLFYDRFLK